MGQRLEEGPGHKEFLQLGPALGLWLLFVLQLVLGPVWELLEFRVRSRKLVIEIPFSARD